MSLTLYLSWPIDVNVVKYFNHESTYLLVTLSHTKKDKTCVKFIQLSTTIGACHPSQYTIITSVHILQRLTRQGHTLKTTHLLLQNLTSGCWQAWWYYCTQLTISKLSGQTSGRWPWRARTMPWSKQRHSGKLCETAEKNKSPSLSADESSWNNGRSRNRRFMRVSGFQARSWQELPRAVLKPEYVSRIFRSHRVIDYGRRGSGVNKCENAMSWLCRDFPSTVNPWYSDSFIDSGK